MLMICNQNLFLNGLSYHPPIDPYTTYTIITAKAIGLPEYIQTQGFTRHKWYPRLKLLAGRKSKQQKLAERLALERKIEEERLAQQNANHCESEKSEIQNGGTDTVVTGKCVDKPRTPTGSKQKVLSSEEHAAGLSHKLAPKTIGLCPPNLMLSGFTH